MADPFTLALGAGAVSGGISAIGSIVGGIFGNNASKRAARAQQAALAEYNKILEAEKLRYQPTVEQGRRASSLLYRAVGLEEDTDYSLRRGYRDYRAFIHGDAAISDTLLETGNRARGAFGTIRGGNAISAQIAAKSRELRGQANSYIQSLGAIQQQGFAARDRISNLTLQGGQNALAAAGIQAQRAYDRSNAIVGGFQGFAGGLRAGISDAIAVHTALTPNLQRNRAGYAIDNDFSNSPSAPPLTNVGHIGDR